jgi:hypothetical protein
MRITVVFLNLLVIIKAVGLVVGLLSQPDKGQTDSWTCFLSDGSMCLQMSSEMSRMSPKASMRSSVNQVEFPKAPAAAKTT